MVSFRASNVQQEANSVSCLNSRAVIGWVRRHHPERAGELFVELPEPWGSMRDAEAYLSDENNWIPSSLVVEFFRRARSISGREDAAFQIGYESILHREYSYLQKLFLTILSSPSGLFKRINQMNTKLNTTKVVEMISNTSGRVAFRWHWKSGITSSKDICEYNKGIYCAVPVFWGIPAARVVESCCHFQGAEYCEITFSFDPTGGLRSALSHLFTRKSTLLQTLEEVDKDKELLRVKADELSTLNEQLKQKVMMLKTINSATRAIVSLSDPRRILAETMAPIVDVLGFDRAIIMLVNPTGEYLEYSYGVGESEKAMEKLHGYRIPITRDQNLMVRVLKRRKPVRIPDAMSAGLNPTNRLLADFRPSSFVVCPLIAEDRTIGILGADRRGDDARITGEDQELLSIFANNIATALERARLDQELLASNEKLSQSNVMLQESNVKLQESNARLRDSYESSVLALVKAIEEKDSYTKGHSQRVADDVVEIARLLGVPDEEVEHLYMGSILHDVGKIGIPEGIVKSPKPLAKSEYKAIQSHPGKGEEIVRPIAYMREYMYLIRNHHERWDGKGYPDGLAGDDIPLGAQIVAVADTFDAMTSDRPYRKGMPKRQALKEIQKNAGTQFSQRVADVFVEYYSRRLSKPLSA